MLIYVAPIRHQAQTVGVLYLEFDWEGQAAAMLHSVQRNASTDTTFSIVDREGKVVATTGQYGFEQRLDVAPPRPEPHVETRNGVVVAQASPEPYHGFDGLDLRCVIEHRSADAGQIAETLRIAAGEPDHGEALRHAS